MTITPGAAELNGKLYAISHRATNRAQAPVQIVGYREPAGLDRKPENAAVRMSAHAVVQEFINLNEQLYGIVTNGRVLRLLRDSSRLIKLSYLEFDLDRIFTDGIFSDFAILYRLLHATRLSVTNETAVDSWIERYHQDSLDSGARIRDGLSQAVERAIRDFGTGFLAQPANTELREAVTNEIRIKLPCGSRGARSRTHTCPPDGKRGLYAHRFPPDLGQPPRLIADAHQEHRLSGVLKNIDDALMLVFEVNRFAVGDQVVMRGGVQHVRQPPSPFLL